MSKISSSDLLFATVTCGGNTLFCGRLSGLASMGEVIRFLRRSLGDAMGLMTLTLRNSSQGWTTRSVLQMAPAEGTQLTLF
ncbi:MAG: hypothetical protein LIO91_09885 [Bacteroidales bacterium]|nr:hypothetical protein [Bacteroidales bacterium]